MALEISPRTRQVLCHLVAGQRPDAATLAESFREVLQLPAGSGRDVILSQLLTCSLVLGPSAELTVALVREALRLDRSTGPALIEWSERPIVAVAGSGKKMLRTFNISTCAAVVAASAGAHVIKAGSSSTSAMSGSADFVEALGVSTGTLDGIHRAFQATRFAFFRIEAAIPRFDTRYGMRFLSLTPLSFALPAIVLPVRCDALVYGLSHRAVDVAFAALRELGQNPRFVVGTAVDDFMVDEFLLTGSVRIARSRADGSCVVDQVDGAAAVGARSYDAVLIEGEKTREANVRLGERVLQGKGTSAQSDTTCANAAVILVAGEVAEDLREGFELARKRLSSGAPYELLNEYSRLLMADAPEAAL